MRMDLADSDFQAFMSGDEGRHLPVSGGVHAAVFLGGAHGLHAAGEKGADACPHGEAPHVGGAETLDELLRMEHVSKRFGDFYANRDINLSVRKGEVHTLLGENGAGKSTLMNVSSGCTSPQRERSS